MLGKQNLPSDVSTLAFSGKFHFLPYDDLEGTWVGQLIRNSQEMVRVQSGKSCGLKHPLFGSRVPCSGVHFLRSNCVARTSPANNPPTKGTPPPGSTSRYRISGSDCRRHCPKHWLRRGKSNKSGSSLLRGRYLARPRAARWTKSSWPRRRGR